MNPILLVDFGSTYTKATAVDIEEEVILGRAQSPTTVEDDVTIGFRKTVDKIKSLTGLKLPQFNKVLACSSAAGGLRMIAIGLVPSLTVEAASRAALGAGAKLVGTFSFELNLDDIEKIRELRPDIILLAGGIDGGNKDNIIHNARMLASSEIDIPVIVAGNRVVSGKVKDILKENGKDARVTSNVMPEINKIEVTMVRNTIREVFVKHIIKAKGLDRVRRLLGDIIMPTPAAVLTAAELLAEGAGKEEGIGDLIIVDVGGATTDIHSISSGKPSQPGIILKGLPEPYAKRTVEGDLGIRYNASNILEKFGCDIIYEQLGLNEMSIKNRIQYISNNISTVSTSEEDRTIDNMLAKYAVKTAMERHAGIIKQVYTPAGEVLFQYGKDLTKVSTIIGCGGIFCYGDNRSSILEGALHDNDNPMLLKPQKANFFTDIEYIMAHMGLLRSQYPEKALRILKKYLYKL